MHTIKNITLAIILLVAGVANARVKHPERIHLQNPSIGFYRGTIMLDVSRGADHRTLRTSTNAISFGFPLINQFKAEVDLSMSNILLTNKHKDRLSLSNKNMLSIPVQVQYYVLPKKSKIQPYFGFGAMIVPDADKLVFTTGEGNNVYKGPGSINMLITQGINIEINTHIHLIESIHVISSEGKTSYGVNLGVNLYVP